MPTVEVYKRCGRLDGVNFDLQALRLVLQDKPCISGIAAQAQAVLDNSESAAFPEFKVHVFDTVSSTNTVAWQLLQQETGTVAIALTQQTGRGQRGHAWQSPIGGLYLSLGLRLNLPVVQSSMLTLSSAWGVAAALQGSDIPVQIKWPNDLVFQGRKLGGLLTETRSSKGQIHQAVIGVGINWRNPVPAMGVNLQTIQADLLKASEQSIDSLETLAAIVLHGLKLGYCYWQQQGLERLVAAYESLLVNRGDEVAIEGKPGKVVGITSTGQLRVQMQQLERLEVCLEPGEICLSYGVKGRR